jgi:4-diphosphocytidyl-2-C-methyl-D-erythritol kinase
MTDRSSGSDAPVAEGAVTVEAPAKLTRTLRITGVRDDGYHLIDAEMVTLDLADLLTIDPAGTGLTADGPFADGVPLDDGNLVARALRLTGRSAHVHLHKRIPHGGGLGGGRARVTGIGEVLDPMPPVALDLTLVIPPLAVSTPAAYRAWDELGGPTADGPNDLEPAAIAVVPELAVWRDRIGDLAGVAPVLAGSGATWFVDGHHPSLQALEPEAMVVFTRTRV